MAQIGVIMVVMAAKIPVDKPVIAVINPNKHCHPSRPFVPPSLCPSVCLSRPFSRSDVNTIASDDNTIEVIVTAVQDYRDNIINSIMSDLKCIR